MKINKKPIHVVQAFKNSYTYSKEFRDFGKRKEWVKWKKQIYSESVIVDEKLRISKSYYENRVGVLDDFLILVDDNYDVKEYVDLIKKLENQENRANLDPPCRIFCGKLKHTLSTFEIFKFGYSQEIEFFLNWNYWTVGLPEREQFKLFELKKDKPVSFLIDGKQDFSSSSRRQRRFLEHNFIFEYKGLFDVEISEKHFSVMKDLPPNPKEINLMSYVN